MGLAKIKAEYLNSVVAYNGGGRKTLGERTDIDQLAIIAQESGSPFLKNLFDVLPSLEDLKKQKVDTELASFPEEQKVADVIIKDESKAPEVDEENEFEKIQDMENKV